MDYIRSLSLKEKVGLGEGTEYTEVLYKLGSFGDVIFTFIEEDIKNFQS